MRIAHLIRMPMVHAVFLSLVGIGLVFPLSSAEDISSFLILATNSIWLRDQARVNSGDIGVKDASAGPWLDADSEASTGYTVFVSNGSTIMADTVTIKPGASVNDVYYNELDDAGIIRGSTYTPLTLLLDTVLLGIPTLAPGKFPVACYSVFKSKRGAI